MRHAVEVKIRPGDKFRRLKPRFDHADAAIAWVTHGHPNATYRIVQVDEPRKAKK